MIKEIALSLFSVVFMLSCTEKKEAERKVFAENEFKEWAQTPPWDGTVGIVMAQLWRNMR